MYRARIRLHFRKLLMEVHLRQDLLSLQCERRIVSRYPARTHTWLQLKTSQEQPSERPRASDCY